MTEPVTYVRSEDLLDESTPKRLARTFRLSRRRQLSGLALAVLLLPLLTLLLDALDQELALDSQVLLYLLAVVIVAMVGGILVAVASAVAAATLINYFFVEPVHTLTVGDPDQVVTLVLFVVVAAMVSASDRARGETGTCRRARPRGGRDDVGDRGPRPRGQGIASRGAPARPRDVQDGVGRAAGAPAGER